MRLRQESRRQGAVPVEIAWSPLARARLREIHAYVANDKPEAAGRLATRIVAVVEALRDHPHLGRVGADPATRELIIGGTPYIVLYRIHRDRVVISTIWHSAQDR
jgi:toxin ParE1/3/4